MAKLSTRRKKRCRRQYHQPRTPKGLAHNSRQVNVRMTGALFKLAYLANKRYRATHPLVADRIRWLIEMDARLVLGLPLTGPLPPEFCASDDSPPQKATGDAGNATK